MMQIANFCLIIGTQKGGTTSLFSYLSQHPQISVSQVKETNFFLEEKLWDKGLDYYEGLWQWDLREHSVALEASPNYTLSLLNTESVVARIKTVPAQFKFIYILRDPIQKIESMRKQGVYQGWYEPLLAKETPSSLPADAIEGVRYAEIANRFVESFSKERVLLLKMDELSAEDTQGAVMKMICRFLEVDPTFEFALDKVHNAQNAYREDTWWHFLRSSQALSPLKELFPDSLKNKARRVLSKPPAASETVVPPLSVAQKAFIKNTLSGEMKQLETTYGLDLESWR